MLPSLNPVQQLEAAASWYITPIMPVGAPSTIKLLIQVRVVLSLKEARKDGIAHLWECSNRTMRMPLGANGRICGTCTRGSGNAWCCAVFVGPRS